MHVAQVQIYSQDIIKILLCTLQVIRDLWPRLWQCWTKAFATCVQSYAHCSPCITWSKSGCLAVHLHLLTITWALQLPPPPPSYLSPIYAFLVPCHLHSGDLHCKLFAPATKEVCQAWLLDQMGITLHLEGIKSGLLWPIYHCLNFWVS